MMSTGNKVNNSFKLVLDIRSQDEEQMRNTRNKVPVSLNLMLDV